MSNSSQKRRQSASKPATTKNRSSTTRRRQSKTPRRFQFTLRHKIAAIVWMSIIIAIVMTVFRQTIANLGSWGYVGAFIINGISSATVVLPAPGGAIVLLMAADYHPLPLGIAAGLGGTLGSLTAYMVGAQARSAFRKRRWYNRAHRLMHRFGFVTLFALTLPPVSPGDFGGIMAGATRYPVHKFLLAVGLASVIKMVALTYGAAASLEWLEAWLRI
ncbi:MAG: VTT domain-containing protein [Dehalococcoidia bacterium]